jgi:hypothetical protein
MAKGPARRIVAFRMLRLCYFSRWTTLGLQVS